MCQGGKSLQTGGRAGEIDLARVTLLKGLGFTLQERTFLQGSTTLFNHIQEFSYVSTFICKRHHMLHTTLYRKSPKTVGQTEE